MRVALVLCFLLVSPSLLAQDFELTSINLTVQNGLAGDNVYCALQDDEGYIWFGTETGVSHYNGRSFENIYMSDGLGDNEIFRIDQDSQGRIWFSAFNGQMSYYHRGRFFNKSNSEQIAAIKFDDFYTNFFEDSKGNVWFSTKTRIAMIDTDGVVRNMEDLGGNERWRVAAFMEKNGEVWGGMGYDRNAHLISPDGTSHNQDSIMLGEGYADFIASHQVYLPTSQPSFPGPYVNAFLDKGQEIFQSISKAHTYANGELWACTFNGAIKIDPKTRSSTIFFKDKQVSHVLRDREGGYWFTTLGDGVFFVPSLEKGAISVIDSEPLGNITALYMQGDVLWFGANDATVGVVSEKMTKSWNLSLNDGRSRVKKIVDPGGDSGLIFAVEEALIKENKDGTFSRLKGALKAVQPWSDSLIVVGTTNQIFVLDRKAIMERFNVLKNEAYDSPSIYFKKLPRLTRILTKGSVIDMELYQGGILISTAHGLYFLDQYLNYRKQSQHPGMNHVINDIKALNDSSYLLATNGFGTFLNRNGTWTNFSTQNGMSSNINRKVFAENDSTFWIATNTGVNRVTGNGDSWQISSIKSTDGLLSEDVNDLVIHDDQLIAATSKGISWINISDWESPKMPPLISMNALLVDDVPLQDEKIDYGVKNITVNYDGLHFQSLDRLVYKYRLSGLDETWRTTRQNTLNFSNLKPGAYTFQVRAISAFGDESELAEVRFLIATPFWMTWWFISLGSLSVLVAFMLIANAIIRRNKRKQERKFEFQLRIAEAERKALQSQLNPHFIFNSLNSIQNMVLDEDPESAYQYLAKFGKLIRRVLEFSDLSMVALNDELETLRLYMDLENLRLNDKFDYQIHIGEGVNLLEAIPSMIMQPHVENSIWHGIMPLKGKKRGKIDITIQKNTEGLHFEVVDNGVGRKPVEAGKRKSMGTKIVNELIRRHKGDGSGEVTVEDLYEGEKAAGTRVKIQILSEHVAYD
ncbi:MAG: hypothetical protein Roseis3KO_35440 [Roseivirga sp.]